METRPVDVRKQIERPPEVEGKPPTKHMLVIQSEDWAPYTRYFGAKEPRAISYMTTELVKKLASGEWLVVEAETEKEGE